MISFDTASAALSGMHAHSPQVVAGVAAADAAVLAAGHIVVLLPGVLVRVLMLKEQSDGQRAAIIASHPLCTKHKSKVGDEDCPRKQGILNSSDSASPLILTVGVSSAGERLCRDAHSDKSS